MEKKALPLSLIITLSTIGIITLSLVCWQFLTEPTPIGMGSTLLVSGLIGGFVIARYRMKNSRYPFTASSLPLGITFFWSSVVIFATGLWSTILSGDIFQVTVTSIISVMLVVMGIVIIK